MSNTHDTMQKITALLKRRGFVWQSSEIYGGAAHAYDYGPLGTLLKNNLKDFWMKSMTKSEHDIVPLDASIIMHPRVWEASGHTENFIDPMVECEKCRRRFRADAVSESSCPECGAALGDEKVFNLMFKTHLGPVEDSANIAYLRPETAQGIYTNYKLVQQTMRLKLPFGIAQVGKAFRNEITPSHFTYRTVEFEQMEMQFFVRPDEAEKWFESWRDARFRWYTEGLGMRPENIRLRSHEGDELAHYAQAAEDVEFHFPFGWSEIEGVHNRGEWDLKRHQEFSGKDLSYFDKERDEKVIPHIVETSAGADRAVLAMLIDAYQEDEENNRTVLRLHPWFAPYRVAIFPLVRKDEKLVQEARDLHGALTLHMSAAYDESGSVGRRYRRHDEIGTPWCVTIDGQTLEDGTVTIRDRDTLTQERVHKDAVGEWIAERCAYSVKE